MTSELVLRKKPKVRCGVFVQPDYMKVHFCVNGSLHTINWTLPPVSEPCKEACGILFVLRVVLGSNVAFGPLKPGKFEVRGDDFIFIAACAVVSDGDHGGLGYFLDGGRHGFRDQARTAKGRTGLDKKGDIGMKLLQVMDF